MAINRAHDFCTAYPQANALIVACEFCSLCYQPIDVGVGSLLSNGLFGDAVAAAVVRGQGGAGIRLVRNGSYLVPDTEDWIAYSVRETGFHFLLDKRVPTTMEPLAPALRSLAERHGWDVSRLDFYIVHAGGPRILNDLCRFLSVEPDAVRFSRDTWRSAPPAGAGLAADRTGHPPGHPPASRVSRAPGSKATRSC